MAYSLNIQGIRKSFGQGAKAVEVLKQIDIAVAPGEFLILVGPSGCGKSTLLNIIAGLEDPSDGRITIGDESVVGIAPAQRDIAMVFQSYALYPTMSVADNIGFPLEMRKMPKPQRLERIQEVAKLLQIEHLLTRKPGQLSGGQRQRVAMGRALAREPKLFLFDEPLSNLDAKLRVEMRAEIKRLHQVSGITSVYVTHDQIEAMTLGTHIAVMKDGLVQQLGTPQQIYKQPANTYVATFMGSPNMNVMPIETQPLVSLANKAATQIGLRPEHLVLDNSSTWRGTVTNIEPTGADVFLQLNTSGGLITLRLSETAADFTPSLGSEVGISFDVRYAHWFASDGRRISELQ
jgi:multiple sugar transport system ATP-binding protein